MKGCGMWADKQQSIIYNKVVPIYMFSSSAAIFAATDKNGYKQPF